MTDETPQPFIVQGEDSLDIGKKVIAMVLGKSGVAIGEDHDLSDLEVAKIGGTIHLIGQVLVEYGEDLVEKTGYEEAEASKQRIAKAKQTTSE